MIRRAAVLLAAIALGNTGIRAAEPAAGTTPDASEPMIARTPGAATGKIAAAVS